MMRGRLLIGVGITFFILLAMAFTMGSLAAAVELSVIDFEGLAEGAFVDEVSFGAGISGADAGGAVEVFGLHPRLPGNMAMIFDATCGGGPPSNCTGGDDDLYKPELGNVLIISADGDPTDPNDADLPGAFFKFDYSGWGTGVVTVNSMDVLDVEDKESGAQIELFAGGEDGTLLATVPIPPTGNNGLATIDVGVSGVDFMRVTLNGSGAIDNIWIDAEPSQTETPTHTPTTTATNTPTATPSNTPAATPSSTPTATPSSTPTSTPTGTPPTPTVTPSPTATEPPTGVGLSSFGGPAGGGGSAAWLWGAAGLLALAVGAFWVRGRRA